MTIEELHINAWKEGRGNGPWFTLYMSYLGKLGDTDAAT